jgi:hypothetical protein
MVKKVSKTSQYRNTIIIDFYLNQWEPIEIPTSLNDINYTIEPRFENRPDLIAYEFFGTPNLWWVIVLRNIETIVDPLTDLTTGKEIIIPAQSTIERLI